MVEEFVLIPKDHFIKENPLMENVFGSSATNEETKAAQLGYIQRLSPPAVDTAASEVVGEVLAPPEISTQKSDELALLRSKIFRELPSFRRNQIERSNIILDKIREKKRVSVKEDLVISLDDHKTNISITTFLYNLQQSRKKVIRDRITTC